MSESLPSHPREQTPPGTPATRRPRRRIVFALAVAATLGVVLAAVATPRSAALWDAWAWGPAPSDSPGRAAPPPSAALPSLFTADARSRRAGVASWMSQLTGEAPAAFAAPPLPVPYDPHRRTPFDSVTTIGGVDYADVTGSGIPLQWVDEDSDEWLSPGLRLRDFVTQDGAPFVRIDPDLVQRLERLRRRAGDLFIVSGYRHPAYNLTVGGHANSQHTAGRAADVWSPNHTSLDLANMALLEMGCDIGIGLNAHTIHVDVRGELTSWTYEGAPLSEAAFDAWTLVQCGRSVPTWLSQAAAATWLDEAEDDLLGERDGAVESAVWNGRGARPSAEALLAEHAAAIVDVVQRESASVGAGGVVLDFRHGPTPRIRYVPTASAEADSLGLPALIAWCAARGNAYVAYAVLLPDETTVGVSNELGIGGNAPPRSGSAPTPERPTPGMLSSYPPTTASGAPERTRSAPPGASASERAPSGTKEWVVITGSFGSEADAEARAATLDDRLETDVFVVAASHIGRYRVAVGPYPSSGAAAQARERFKDVLPADAWIAPR